MPVFQELIFSSISFFRTFLDSFTQAVQPYIPLAVQRLRQFADCAGSGAASVLFRESSGHLPGHCRAMPSSLSQGTTRFSRSLHEFPQGIPRILLDELSHFSLQVIGEYCAMREASSFFRTTPEYSNPEKCVKRRNDRRNETLNDLREGPIFAARQFRRFSKFC